MSKLREYGGDADQTRRESATSDALRKADRDAAKRGKLVVASGDVFASPWDLVTCTVACNVFLPDPSATPQCVAITVNAYPGVSVVISADTSSNTAVRGSSSVNLNSGTVTLYCAGDRWV